MLDEGLNLTPTIEQPIGAMPAGIDVEVRFHFQETLPVVLTVI
jgi:hypothetical protein